MFRPTLAYILLLTSPLLLIGSYLQYLDTVRTYPTHKVELVCNHVKLYTRLCKGVSSSTIILEDSVFKVCGEIISSPSKQCELSITRIGE